MTAWLFHGFTGSGPDWDPLLQRLPAIGDVWAPSLIPDQGDRGPLPFESLDAASEALAARPTEPADVVGYSMGGRLALTFAVVAPDRVRSLVLIGASPGLADPQERAARTASDEALAARVEQVGTAAFADYWETVPILASQARIEPGVLAGLRRRRRARSASATAAVLRGWGAGAMRPLHADLARLDVPVLLVTGEDDPKFRAIADDMAAALPRAERFDVPGAGHTAHLERPVIVARRLAAFLATVRS